MIFPRSVDPLRRIASVFRAGWSDPLTENARRPTIPGEAGTLLSMTAFARSG